jgi:hypothetical protein
LASSFLPQAAKVTAKRAASTSDSDFFI